MFVNICIFRLYSFYVIEYYYKNSVVYNYAEKAVLVSEWKCYFKIVSF